MKKETLHEKANRLMREAIFALADAITADIKKLSENGSKEVVLECNRVGDGWYDEDYDCVASYDAKTDKVSFSIYDSNEVSVDDIEVGRLMDIQNALLCDRYHIKGEEE